MLHASRDSSEKLCICNRDVCRQSLIFITRGSERFPTLRKKTGRGTYVRTYSRVDVAPVRTTNNRLLSHDGHSFLQTRRYKYTSSYKAIANMYSRT